MVLLNRLEKYAERREFFSEMQCRRQECVGCIEAFFIVLETINHMLERGSEIFSCLLDVRKAFDNVWIDGLLYKLSTELGVNGGMWLAIKDTTCTRMQKLEYYTRVYCPECWTFHRARTGHRARENFSTVYVHGF